MKITDLWKSSKKPTVSFELFPARSAKAAEGLEKIIDEIAALKPDFVSVTFGAGGSTRKGSYNLVKKLIKDKGLRTVAYFTCYGLGPSDIKSVLDSYRDLGVETILAARGDPPHDQPDFGPHPESLAHASDLIAFVRPRYSFCIAAAGYPEKHIEAQNPEKDREYLKLKVQNGADFVITNYFYDNTFFFDFERHCRGLGINVPLLPGIMPIYSVKMMENLAALCGATITAEIRDGIAKLPAGDAAALQAFGVEFALAQCRGLLKTGVPGLHFYTMDRSAAVVPIVTKLRAEGCL
jgi:methylenetetrahydrofolate reductase (NADPH)